MTQSSPHIPFITEDYSKDPYEPQNRTTSGQLRWHHTSDQVTWYVDGEPRFHMLPSEFRALAKAIETFKDDL